jgi:hypothetical protein
MAVLAPFQIANVAAVETFISSIIIAGCTPSTCNGTYSRTSKGPTNQDDPENPVAGGNTFNGPNGNRIEWPGSNYWKLMDTQSDPLKQFINLGGELLESGWTSEEVGTFGTATNIYSPV